MRHSLLAAFLIAVVLILIGTVPQEIDRHVRLDPSSTLSFTPFHGAPAEHSGISFLTRKYRPRSTQPTSADDFFCFRVVPVGVFSEEAMLSAMVTERVWETWGIYASSDVSMCFTTAERKLFAHVTISEWNRKA